MTTKSHTVLLLAAFAVTAALVALPHLASARGGSSDLGRESHAVSAAGAGLSAAVPSGTPQAGGVDPDAATRPGELPTALCADHYFSYSRAKSGICGSHGGVLVWLSNGPHDASDIAPTPTTGPAPTPFPLDTIPGGTDPDAPLYSGALPTALCADGWFSYSHASSGVCALHGGVTVWFTPGPHDPLDQEPTPTPTPLPFGGAAVL